MKFCSGCNKEKDLSEFGKDRWREDGFTRRCKECRNKFGRQWRKNNTEIVKKINDSNIEKRKKYYAKPEIKEKHKNTHLKRSYGLSLEKFNYLLKLQNGLCAICKKPESAIQKNTGILKTLSVDHCHKTGKVRGLLCVDCNRGLGCFKDNIKYITNVLNYLKRGKHYDFTHSYEGLL